MSETVYRLVGALNQEVERLKAELDSVVGDCERSHAERLSVLRENARLTERNRALESELEALRGLRS